MLNPNRENRYWLRPIFENDKTGENQGLLNQGFGLLLIVLMMLENRVHGKSSLAKLAGMSPDLNDHIFYCAELSTDVEQSLQGLVSTVSEKLHDLLNPGPFERNQVPPELEEHLETVTSKAKELVNYNRHHQAINVLHSSLNVASELGDDHDGVYANTSDGHSYRGTWSKPDYLIYADVYASISNVYEQTPQAWQTDDRYFYAEAAHFMLKSLQDDQFNNQASKMAKLNEAIRLLRQAGLVELADQLENSRNILAV